LFKTLTNFQKVQEFNQAMGVKHNMEPINIVFRFSLIQEELEEALAEVVDDANNTIEPVNRQKLAKELADLLYVVYGAADSFDIDVDEAFRRVHASNMSKLGEDGKPVRREDGKVLKGPNYQAPDMSFVV
jgi:predicted HAD superfamily Cof-like phosphohydrolase